MELRILGPLEVIGDDGPIGLPAGRPRTLLLALLVRPNEPVSVDRLVEDLWSGAPPASAPKIVQGYVGQLRRALGDQRIVTRGHAYQLKVEPGELDVERVETMRAEARTEEPAQRSEMLRGALALFRGPPLEDAADEPFARVERERLAELRLALLIERLEADLLLGRHAELVGELEALVAHHPLDERLRAQLLVALYRSGRQADALTAYADLRRTLAADLGLEPSDQLRALQRHILEHDPSLAPPHLDQSPVATSAQPVPSGRFGSPRIVVGAGIALLAAVAGALMVAAFSGEEAALVVPTNALAVIDAEKNRVVAAIPVGGRPTSIAVGAGAVWVANVSDKTVSRVDPHNLGVTATIGLGFEPTDIAADDRYVWVVGGYDHILWRLDTDGVARLKMSFGERFGPLPEGHERGPAGVALTPGTVWLSHGDEISALDPETGDARWSVKAGGRWHSAIASDGENVLVGFNDTARPGPAGQRYGPNPRVELVAVENREVVEQIDVISNVTEIMVASGFVWISIPFGNAVWQLAGDRVVRTIPAGNEPVGLGFAGDAVWVSNQLDGVVRRLDPRSGEVEAMIDVGHTLEDVDVAEGMVFVAVRKP